MRGAPGVTGGRGPLDRYDWEGCVLEGSTQGRSLRLWRRPLAVRLAKFSASSAVAAMISEITFVIVYGALDAGARLAGVVAFLAGAIPNWGLNRRWTWQRRGRPRLGREVLPYVAVVLSTAVAATMLGGVADGWAQGIDAPRSLQVGLVAMAYLLPYGAVFLLKFVLFDRVVFSDPPLRSPAVGSRVEAGERAGPAVRARERG
jgi:putative flippase GtrA